MITSLNGRRYFFIKRKSNNSHITLEGRKYIEEKLNEGCSITKIANELCRNKSSIIREIDRNITLAFPSVFNGQHSCIKWKECDIKDFNCYKNCKI